MGLFGWFSSTKKPDPGTAVLSRPELEKALLALNRDTAPYGLGPGDDEGVDLIAQWKIVDVAWYEIFAKAGLKKVYKIYMRLDEEHKQVRAVDREYEVSWRAGAPSLSLAAKAFRGQSRSIQFGMGVVFTEELKPGLVYKYRFSTKELKDPIIRTVLASGWAYKPVVFGRL